MELFHAETTPMKRKKPRIVVVVSVQILIIIRGRFRPIRVLFA